ncbi:MAG: hypothetical protein HXM80_08945 [Neisseria sicca]|uniref:LPS-assembly lipoprotein LptE n=1 Tax=Neisseria sicca TaxID=490 RepID=A0A930GUQ1_NEISI|nr:hypothetical protein [Neisseria sicca]
MNKILMTAAVLLLSACGFHLKGMGGTARTLPYPAWHIQNASVMQKALENALRRADGKPVSAAEAQMTLHIKNIETRQDIYTIARAALVNEYLLTLRVEAQAMRNGEPVGEPMTILVNRTMDYNDSEVLGKQEESETIWAEMRADAADQIVRRLTFLKAY